MKIAISRQWMKNVGPLWCLLHFKCLFEQFLREMIGGLVDQTSSLFWLDEPLWNISHYSLAKANEEKKASVFVRMLKNLFFCILKCAFLLTFISWGTLRTFGTKPRTNPPIIQRKFSTDCRKKSGIALLFFKFSLWFVQKIRAIFSTNQLQN